MHGRFIEPGVSARTSKRVLVVDDSATNRFLLKAILTTVGYEVDETGTGPDCIKYCAEKLPAMVLLDVMMPEMDGIATCFELRKRFSQSELPIIMVTTKTEGQDVAAGLEAGANDYVSKPIDRGVLLARMENQLALSRSRQELEEKNKAVRQSLRIQSAIGDVLPEAIAVHDRSGAMVYANQQLTNLCRGYRAASIEEVFRQLYSGAVHTQCTEAAQKTQGDLEAHIDREFWTGTLCIQLISKPVSLDDGTMLRIWVWRDLTATRELERRIAQQMKLETVALFCSGVSHNFNNILGVVLGATELLEHFTRGDARAEKCITAIKKGVHSGMRLTHNMAGLVRREPSKGVELVEVRSAVALVVELAQERFGSHVEFIVSMDEVASSASFDFIKLSEIFNNIVDNAAESITGRGRITIHIGNHDDPRFTAITFVDSGHGMTPEVIEKVFEPFFSTKKLDDVNGVSVQGHGLGLWKVHSLLKSLGGNVEFTSAPGKGTTVRVLLPVTPPAA